jgi:DNA-binding winged helix-turn-helix (wHTH) protein
MEGSETYTFGAFTLEIAERRLSNAGLAISLAPKAYDLLVVLVRNAGRLVAKSDLLTQVWPESFVEEGILSVHISALRKALGHEGHQYIETVPRAGYRFIANVTVPAARFSIAVLPARRISQEVLSGHDWPTGLTLADALIDRLGRFDQILIRPTRAIQSYREKEGKGVSLDGAGCSWLCRNTSLKMNPPRPG